MDLNILLNEFIDSLDKEILKKKEKAVNRPVIVKDGYRHSEMPSGMIYRFEEFAGNVMPDSPTEIEILDIGDNNENKFNALVVGVENEVLSLCIFAKNLPDQIEKARLVIDNVKLLESTRDTIIKIRDSEENPPRILADKAFGLKEIISKKEKIDKFPNEFNQSQKEAVKLTIGSDVTFIWGPPGTGKSQTLGNIAEKLLKNNYTLLITAHTNEAVDGLMEKIIKLFNEKQINEGQIIRWRVTQSKKLINITPSAIISKQCEKLMLQQDGLKKQKNEAETNLKVIKDKYNFYKEKLDLLSQKKEQMIKSEKEYNKSRSLLQNLQQESIRTINSIKNKEKEIEIFERKNLIIKFITKNRKERLVSGLLDLREKEASQKVNIDSQAQVSASKKEIFKIANEEYENYYSELCKCKIDVEQMMKLEDNLCQEKDWIVQLDKQIESIQKELARIREDESKLLKNARVVGTTLTSCTLNPQIRERTFNVAIVDEVSMAPCPNLFASCALATDKVIQCGDFYQLSPIAEESEAVWLKNSIFDKCGITTKVTNNKELKDLAVLDTQYRNHPDIANSIIDIVYKGKLKNGLVKNHENFHAQYLEPYPNNACILLDTSKVSTISNPWCEKKGLSWINPNTAELSLKLTEDGLKSGIKSIGIITPYNAQAKYIRSKLGALREAYPDKKIEAATVHKYQGREMDMIIFDLIDGPPKSGLAPFLKGLHGSEAMRLINVATTRARGKLIVVANVDFIEQTLYKEKDYKNHILYQWIQYLKTQKYDLFRQK